MPYSRQVRRRRRKAPAAPFARRVRSVFNKQVETKWAVYHQSNSIDVNGAVYPLMSFQQGADQGQRIGNRIRISSIHIDCHWLNNDVTTAHFVRFCVYKLHTPHDSNPPFAENAAISPDALIVKKYDSCWMTPNTGGPATKKMSFHKRFGNGGSPEVRYSAATGPTSIAGEWYLILYSSATAGTTPVVSSLDIQIFYKDA